MNTQIIIDFPIVAAGVIFYFSMKLFYTILCYCCPYPSSSWSSGYLAGHNALADKIRPDIQEINKGYKKMQEQLEKAIAGEVKHVTKTDDRKVPGQE